MDTNFLLAAEAATTSGRTAAVDGELKKAEDAVTSSVAMDSTVTMVISFIVRLVLFVFA